jgi:hypothetical protein
MQTWTASRFRSSRALDLKRLDELPPEQRAAFAELQKDGDFYGLLVPRVAGAASIKSVGRQTARLFESLATPARIDAAFIDDAADRDDVVDLVLDGILEIEIGGAFRSGADAFRIVAPELPEAIDRGAIGRLSREALQHAEDLATNDTAALTNALYSYNRMPLTRTWSARFPDRDAVLAHIGANDGATASLLDRHWMRTPKDKSNGWISWQSRVAPPTPPAAHLPTWKLYVSPHPEEIADVFRALVRVLAGIAGAQMKIGSDAGGLLRPDKLVAYFASRDDVRAAASALAAEIAGCRAHGVPFTAGIGNDGLLSWGLDPPDSERPLSWLERESWRLWIAKSLAAALALAKQATRPDVEPWRFAVERVRRHGVDVDTWTPADSLWRPAA